MFFFYFYFSTSSISLSPSMSFLNDILETSPIYETPTLCFLFLLIREENRSKNDWIPIETELLESWALIMSGCENVSLQIIFL